MTDRRKNNVTQRILSGFARFERIISIVLSTILGLLIIISTIRVLITFYQVFLNHLLAPTEIVFQDYQMIFGMILTLLISIEFMNSILKAVKSKDLRSLLLDVIMIAGIAIVRKLIILDYDKAEAMIIFADSALLIGVGIFYYLVKNGGSLGRSKNDWE